MTATLIQIVDADRLAILKLLVDGRDLSFARAANTHLSEEQVRQIAQSHGYPDKAKMEWAIDEIRKHIDAKARGDLPPVSTPDPKTVVTSPRPTAAPAPVDFVKQLLEQAAAHPKPRVQALGRKAQAAITALRDALAKEQAAERAKRLGKERQAAERRARDAAKQQVRDEVARLEAELKAAKAKLRGGPSKQASKPVARPAPSSPSSNGYLSESGRVRAWARDNGVACPEKGPVPNRVRDAYDAAQEAQAS